MCSMYSWNHEKGVVDREQTIPLTEAGHRLGLSYNQILRRVMVGEVRGKRVDGRWRVDVDEVERLQKPDEVGSDAVGAA